MQPQTLTGVPAAGTTLLQEAAAAPAAATKEPVATMVKQVARI